jgi:SAM-dependent methyltransferase
MTLKKLQENWDGLAKLNPTWAILTERNDWDINEFFHTGCIYISKILNHIKSRGYNLNCGKALDFGCGMGRLTQALSQRFNNVIGVDISPTMVELANKYNKYKEKCQYIINNGDDLKQLGNSSFDFIISHITLQHIQPIYAIKYILEFLRILAQGGILVFQLPSRLALCNVKNFIINYSPNVLLRIYRSIRNYNNLSPRMEMYMIKEKKILNILKANNAKIVDIVKDASAGNEYVSLTYFVTK